MSGYHAEHITGDLDLVVVGNAISRGNPELEEVLDRKIRYCSLPEAIREHFLWGARSIVIAGTHGKTTTTALAGWLLTDGGLDPSVLVGGIVRNFGPHGSSYRIGQGPRLRHRGRRVRQRVLRQDGEVPEVPAGYCRHQQCRVRSRRHLCGCRVRDAGVPSPREPRPQTRPAAPRRRQRACARPRRRRQVACRDASARRTASTGRRTTSKRRRRRRRFKVRRGGAPYGTFEVPLVGAHNVRNATAAIAIAAEVGIGAERVAEGLRRFAGVKRRLEVLGIAAGVTVYDDFAHHPTAVAETLAGLRAANPSARIWAVFEPRSASSCRRIFQDDFARAFGGATEVLIAPVFRSTLPEAERLSVPQLVRDLNEPRSVGPRGGVAGRHHRDRSFAITGRAISSCSCRMADSAASIRSC